MSNIKISRYHVPTEAERAAWEQRKQAEGITQTESPFISDAFAGLIEPEDRSWIIFLDADGKPSHYYPHRDQASGAVMCDPVLL